MSEQVKIVALAGSTREKSFNRQALQVAVKGAREAGAEVEVVDLNEFQMPLFNQDLEANQGAPDAVNRLREIFKQSDGMLIASPEYNGSLTPLLKNTIDWISRPAGGDPGLVAFSGKTAAILSASPGALGGLRGLVHLRAILSGINVLVLPQQVAIPSASSAFADDGSIKDEKRNEAMLQLGRKLVETASRLRN
ncbi:MAG: NAD(P)H-dependent oxidoreductase [Bdellovibrionales bacterium]|nr:NAD(P)H-dependent oxidoreductase [Bdellovibrionales bacterium]